MERGIRTFGPSKRAAMLEGSKLFAKRIMRACGVPTGEYHEFVFARTSFSAITIRRGRFRW